MFVSAEFIASFTISSFFGGDPCTGVNKQLIQFTYSYCDPTNIANTPELVSLPVFVFTITEGDPVITSVSPGKQNVMIRFL